MKKEKQLELLKSELLKSSALENDYKKRIESHVVSPIFQMAKLEMLVERLKHILEHTKSLKIEIKEKSNGGVA